jgi:hypothetical protein
MKESLVEVSPSTLMQLNDSSAASRSSCCSSGAATPASVAMKPSMVAMFGRIMPAPLLMPVMVTRLAVDLEAPRGGFGDRVGGHDGVRGSMPVVARRSAIQAGRPAIRRSTGKGSRITPVEKGSTWRSSIASSWPRAAQVSVRRLPALLAGAGVGDAGVDDQRADRCRVPDGGGRRAPVRRKSGCW